MRSFAERDSEFEERLASAKTAPDADRQVSLLLANSGTLTVHRTKAASVSGKLQGSHGSMALAEEFRAAMSRMEEVSGRSARRLERDLVCSCVMALAKRDEQAMDIYLTALTHSNPEVSDYGAAALASSGDDSAWENVFQLLEARLRRSVPASGVGRSWLRNAFAYLDRHAQTDVGRTARLTQLLQVSKQRLGDDRWMGSA